MSPPPRNRAEAQAVIDALATRDAEIRRDEDNQSRYIKNAELFVRYAWLFGVVIVTITLFVAAIQWKSQELEAKVAKLEAHSETMRDTLLVVQNTITTNRTERVSALDKVQVDIDALKKDAPKMAHLWAQRIMGINNSDAYRRSKPGFDPSNPDSAPEN